MFDNLPVISGDGGSPPAPRKPVEADDTLSSRQRLRMLFAVCEGEIESIDEVYVNGSPIAGFDASFEYRTGTVDQDGIQGFSQVETPASPSVNTQLTAGVPIVRSVSSNAVDAVRVTIRINSLFKILENGDQVGHTVSFQVKTRKDSNDTWTVQHSITKNDKGSKPYKMDVRVERPANAVGSTWEIAVERTSPDDVSSKQSSVTFFDNYIEIQDVALNYPHTALLGVIFNNADQLGGKIPTISCEGKWWKVNVPDASIYNPVTRTYLPGTWSGAWALAKHATSCLAWVMYAVLTDTRAGLGISESVINKYSFFDFAVECDELVDNGNGGLEHRFSINNQFYRRENAATFLTFLQTLGNCKLANDEFGLISIVSDRPVAPSKVVNNSNVIDGVFDYPSAELDETFSWVNVTFNDPDDKHNTTTIFEKRQDRIDRFGLIKSDIVLVGCTSEGQARRKAKWALYAPEGSCVYKVGLEGMIYRIGEVVTVMDDYKRNVKQQGRIISASSDASFTTVVLDRDIELLNQSYSILCYGADAVMVYDVPIIEQNITTSTVTINAPGPLATDPNPNSPYIISGDIKPAQFQVQSIERDEDVFTILATQYDPDKRTLIESGVVNRVPTAPFINTQGFTVEPVENIVFSEIFASSLVGNLGRIAVSWDWDIDGSSELVASFQYSWRRDNLPFHAIQTTTLPEFEIPDATPGVYEVVITAFNPRGIQSVPVVGLYNYRIIAAQSSLKPPTDFYVVNTVSNQFQHRDLSVSWFYDPANDDRTIVNDSLLDYVLEIWSAGVLKNSYTVQPTKDKNGLFTYTFQDNENDHGGTASRSVEMRVYSRDTVGDVSLAITNTFTNPVPPVVSFALLAGTGAAYVDITPPVDPDIAGYLVYRDTVDGFTPGAGNLVYDDVNAYVALGGDSGTLYYYRVAAYDSFGKSSPNISGQQSSTTLSAETDKFAFTGLQFTPNSPSVNSVAWAAGTVTINGAAPVAIAAGNAAWTSGTLYLYFDKNTVSIGSTTDQTVAVTKSQILAAYQGAENLYGGDGTAFFNGAQLIAQSVGANQLVANSAIITQAAQLATAIINNAHIENLAVTSDILAYVIQSLNFSDVNKTGWQFDRQGFFKSYGDVELLDANGNSILTTGANAQLQWAKVAGGGRPEDKATVGAAFDSNILGQITAANIATYMANAAIQHAQIGTLAVGTGNIQDLAVKTLQIGDNSATVSVSSNSPAVATPNGVWTVFDSALIEFPTHAVNRQAILLVTLSNGRMNTGGLFEIRFLRDSTVIHTFPLIPSTGNFNGDTVTLSYTDSAPSSTSYMYKVEIRPQLSIAQATIGSSFSLFAMVK